MCGAFLTASLAENHSGYLQEDGFPVRTQVEAEGEGCAQKARSMFTWTSQRKKCSSEIETPNMATGLGCLAAFWAARGSTDAPMTQSSLSFLLWLSLLNSFLCIYSMCLFITPSPTSGLSLCLILRLLPQPNVNVPYISYKQTLW